MKFIIEVEDGGNGDMDSGCIDSILRECVNHGKVTACRVEGTDINTGKPFSNDLMEVFHPEEMIPAGSC